METLTLTYDMGQATSTLLDICYSLFDEIIPLPKKSYNIPLLVNKLDYPWELSHLYEDRVDVGIDELHKKLRIIEVFACNLTSDMRDLEPEFAQVINEDFWELL